MGSLWLKSSSRVLMWFWKMNNVSIEWQRCFYHPLITNHHSDIRLKMVKMWFKSQNNLRHATFNLKPISEDSLVLAQGNQGLAILFIRVIERSRRRDNRPPKINAFPLIRFSSLNRFCFYPGSFESTCSKSEKIWVFFPTESRFSRLPSPLTTAGFVKNDDSRAQLH